jgi:hypothetical protein
VGEDHFLSYTRAQILRDWEPVITDSTDAPLSIHTRAYDLVIFCHTVPDSVAKEIMACARKQYPDVKFLAIDEGWEPRLGLGTFTAEIIQSGRSAGCSGWSPHLERRRRTLTQVPLRGDGPPPADRPRFNCNRASFSASPVNFAIWAAVFCLYLAWTVHKSSGPVTTLRPRVALPLHGRPRKFGGETADESVTAGPAEHRRVYESVCEV